MNPTMIPSLKYSLSTFLKKRIEKSKTVRVNTTGIIDSNNARFDSLNSIMGNDAEKGISQTRKPNPIIHLIYFIMLSSPLTSLTRVEL